MILLDSDHLTILKYVDSDRAIRLRDRLADAMGKGNVVGTTITNIEEAMRG